jgi:TetR/AcrR family transcriptional regulator, lmrAB and yxaGH operons repressor
LATAKLNDVELAERAAETFRLHGYEGTSLNRLAEATGLEKASLYYRFPGGKDAILMAAVNAVGAWFEANVFGPLRQPGSLAQRVEAVAARLREFYGDGIKPCMLDTLSLRGGTPELQSALQGALSRWLRTFAAVAVEAGFESEEAQRRSEQAVIAIEGSLVLARVTGKSDLFLRAVAELGPRLIGQ